MIEPRCHIRIPDEVKGLLKRNGQPQAMWYVGTLQAEGCRDIRVRSAGDLPKCFERPLDVRRPGGDPGYALLSGYRRPGA
jgi:hypothetical protein